MSDLRYYMIYRVYDESSRNHLYGWCTQKILVKALLSQRDKSKYKVVKMYDDEIADMYSENGLDTDLMIDQVKLRSSLSGDDVMFFTTKSELMEAEKGILRYLRDLPRLVERDKGNLDLLELFHNMKDYYKDALDLLGFRPPELETLFDRDDYVSCDNSIESMCKSIDDTYRFAYYEVKQMIDHPIGLPSIDTELYTQVIYSLEAFVKILREDL